MTVTESVEKLKRAKASRKAHVAIIISKQATSEQIVGKATQELTDEDRNTAESLLASLSDKQNVVDSLSLEILDFTEKTYEQMETENFHRGGILMILKSLVRKTEFWLSANLQYKRVLLKNEEENIRLSWIELPTFGDACKDWVPFFDRFKGTVDNNSSLPAVPKLHYFKGASRGEAKNLLAHFSHNRR